MLDLTKLPHRLREKSFRVYEGWLKDATKKFPEVYIMETPGSIETLSARLRDAKSSVLRYNWKTDIDLTTLKQISIGVKDGQVLIGPVSAIRQYGKVPYKTQNQESPLNPQDYIELELFPLDSASLLKCLIIQKGLKKPIHVITPLLNLSELLTSLDIAHIENETGVTILP